MFALVIALCVLALGKIAGQQAVVTQTVSSQHAPAQGFRAYERRYSTQGPQDFKAKLSNTDYTYDAYFLPFNGSERNTNLNPVAVSGNQPPRRGFFAPEALDRGSSKMSLQPSARTATSSATFASLGSQNVSEDKTVQVNQGKTGRGTETPPILLSKENPSKKPEDPAAGLPQANVPQVTIEQRANFDGDKCPTGYVKVNGSNECVLPD